MIESMGDLLVRQQTTARLLTHLDVLGHDGDTLGVDGAQVGVLE